jgi:hypothetical protein
LICYFLEGLINIWGLRLLPIKHNLLGLHHLLLLHLLQVVLSAVLTVLILALLFLIVYAGLRNALNHHIFNWLRILGGRDHFLALDVIIDATEEALGVLIEGCGMVCCIG